MNHRLSLLVKCTLEMMISRRMTSLVAGRQYNHVYSLANISLHFSGLVGFMTGIHWRFNIVSLNSRNLPD